MKSARRSALLKQVIHVWKVDLRLGWWHISTSIKGLPEGKNFQRGVVGSVSEWICSKIIHGDQCSTIIMITF